MYVLDKSMIRAAFFQGPRNLLSNFHGDYPPQLRYSHKILEHILPVDIRNVSTNLKIKEKKGAKVGKVPVDHFRSRLHRTGENNNTTANVNDVLFLR